MQIEHSFEHKSFYTLLPHTTGTAPHGPPMPPSPLLQSLPEPPRVPGCGRRAYVAGGEGLHAPLERHGNVQPRHGGQRESAQSSKHQQNAARQYAYMRAPCTHSNACSKTTSQAGHAVQSKQSIGHKPIHPCRALVSSMQGYCRAGSAPTSTGECVTTSIPTLPQILSS